MRIESAIERQNFLEVIVDGRRLIAGDKYTILETGYAVYTLKQADEQWIRENGETLPGDPADDRGELPSTASMLVTSDPILVALALESWWHRNGKPHAINKPLPIPLFQEAVQIVRKRPILNEWNRRWTGVVPSVDRLTPSKKHR